MDFGTLLEPDFVGRCKELQELLHYWTLAANGNGTAVIIAGEAGSGKTRLIKEFLKRFEKNYVTILTGWCLSEAGLPYFPFIEAFDTYSSSTEEESTSAVNRGVRLKSWLMQTNHPQGDEKVDLQPQIWRDQAFYAVGRELLSLSVKKPLILFLEDIHWADSASLSLIHYIAHLINNERILMLATLREEELTDKEGHPNALSQTLALMRRDSLYKELKVPNLSTADIRKITENMIGGTAQPELIEKLSIDSHGNPLFVIEFLRMLHWQRRLSKKNGKWGLNSDGINIPQKVRDIILRRLEQLHSDQREILDVASVIGDKFDPKLVATTVAADSIKVLRTLHEIARSTKIISAEINDYKFEHAKVRETIYKEISPILRKEYHSRIALAIERNSQQGTEISITDLAHHFVQADDKTKAVKYSLKAGVDALSRFSNIEAIDFFSYVRSVTQNNPEFLNENEGASEGLGDAFLANAMFDESVQIFESLSDSTKAYEVSLRTIRKAMNAAFHLGDIPLLMRLLKKAEPYATANRLEKARILVNKGRVLHLQSKFLAAMKCMDEALKIFEEEYSLWDTALTLLGLGIYHAAWKGMLKEGLAESLRSAALFEELGDFRLQMEACWLAGGVSLSGNLLFPEAEKMLIKVNEINDNFKVYDRLALAYANAYLSRCFSLADDFEHALSNSLKALELSRNSSANMAYGLVCSNLTMQYARLGDLKHADEYLAKLKKLPQEIIVHPLVNGKLAEAVYFAGKCEWERSSQAFKTHFELSKGNFYPSVSFGAKKEYGWALQNQGRFEEANFELKECQRIHKEAEERFGNTDLQVYLMTPRKVSIGQVFEARLDIVNVSRVSTSISQVENLFNPHLTIELLSDGCTVRNRIITLDDKTLDPFGVKTIKLKLKAQIPGEISLSSKVNYANGLKKTETTASNKIFITIQELVSSTEEKRTTPLPQINLVFKAKDAQKVLDFLIKAFLEDYVAKRLPAEESGWRTLMDMVRKGKISRYAAYGSHGYGRLGIIELNRRGLVESRYFSKERGRGGKILKLRILYDNEIVKERLIAKK